METNAYPFANELLRWFDRHGRDLPWRYTRDAYAIWLSEIILQQTRIAQGTAYWERFMERFPTVEHLAEATEDEVLRLWQGLGYYSRARNLHAAARRVVERGGFPDTVDGLRMLKGVGDYTAAAIAAFAFGRQVAAVDGNAYRVLARVFGIHTPIDSNRGKKEFAALAQSLVPRDRPADFNQAMMDFGATQCVPSGVPDCAVCPFVEVCVAHREGLVDQLPVKEKRTRVTDRHLTYVYIRHDGQTAIHRRGAGDIWQGLWEPWLVEGQDSKPLLVKGASEIPRLASSQCRLVAKDVRHVLTHQRLLADLYLWTPERRPALPEGYQWVDEERLDDYAKPRLVELLLERISSIGNAG